MSRNLVDILRAHEPEGRPTALAVLKEAMDARGEITDDDRRRAAALSGLPEATVYGVSTFYDDLIQPRGRRHVSVCTGTACWAADFGAHVAALEEGLGVARGERSADGEVSIAQTVCLGFCHAAGAVREGDVVDAGPGVVDRVLAGDDARGGRAGGGEHARRAGAARARHVRRAAARARRAQPGGAARTA